MWNSWQKMKKSISMELAILPGKVSTVSDGMDHSHAFWFAIN